MMYLSYITNSYSLKNSLEKAVYEFLLSKERVLIAPEDLKRFKVDLLLGIEKLNEQNRRCRPVEPSWNVHDHKGFDDHSLWINGICNYYIYASRS